MLANNYKVLCFRLQNVSNYEDTANAAKAGLVRKIQTQKFLVYLHFFEDLLPTLRKMSLVFQTDNLCVCSVPRYLEQNIAFLEKLQVVPGESFRKLGNQVNTDEYGVVTYKEVALTFIPHTRNQARNPTESFEDFYDNFNHLMGDMTNYIKQRFATFKEPPLCYFTVFDVNLRPDNLIGFGQKEISKLVTYYYISEKKKKKQLTNSRYSEDLSN